METTLAPPPPSSSAADSPSGATASPYEMLHEAVDRVLAVDTSDLSDGEVHDAVMSLCRADDRLAAALYAVADVWDARQIWADGGARAAGVRLANDTGWSDAHAKAVIRRARALRRMPDTADALAQGRLAPEHVDLIARAAKNASDEVPFAESEADMIDWCATFRFKHARGLIDYWIAHADPDGDDDRGERLHQKRSFAAAETIDGIVHLSGMLDPVGAEAFTAELDRLDAQLADDDRRTGTVRTVGQRRADALVEMAERSAASPPDGRRPRPLVTILAGVDSFSRICELANGTRIAPGQVVPLLGDADIETVVFDAPDRVMSVSHRRTFTGAVRRAVEVRDQFCTHPSGCDEPAKRCDVDHDVPHSHGGPTSEANGRLLCSPHNRHHVKRHQTPGPHPRGRTTRRPRGIPPTRRRGPGVGRGSERPESD